MILEINKLSVGLHELDFEETSEELGMESKETFPNMTHSHVLMDKSENHIYIKATVSSLAHFFCDRCLKEFDQELSDTLILYYELETPEKIAEIENEKDLDANEDVRLFQPDMKEIDITKDVRDTLLLAIPMKKLCSPECKGICSRCGSDLNVESCTCESKPIDPRWEKLKELLPENS